MPTPTAATSPPRVTASVSLSRPSYRPFNSRSSSWVGSLPDQNVLAPVMGRVHHFICTCGTSSTHRFQPTLAWTSLAAAATQHGTTTPEACKIMLCSLSPTCRALHAAPTQLFKLFKIPWCLVAVSRHCAIADVSNQYPTTADSTRSVPQGHKRHHAKTTKRCLQDSFRQFSTGSH